MGLLAVVLGICCSEQRLHWPVLAGIVVTLLMGSALGLLNGVLVTVGRIPSIIVTLGMLTALRGVTILLMAGQTIEYLPQGLRTIGTGSLLGVPISLLVAALVITGSVILARDTPLGRRLYAAGSNAYAAALAGLPVDQLKVFAFVLTGFLTAVSTVVTVPQLSVIEAGTGQGLELAAVTAAVVGGTSISGGRGSITGTMLAALFLSMVRTILIFLRLGPQAAYWESAVQGAFILGAVLVDHLARQRTGSEAHA